MVRHFLIVLLIVASFSFSAAQDGSYFQQEVNYRINVTLNDVNHTLKGTVSIDYTNNSPDELSFIYFHLWPNAYQDLNTALAKQQLESGNTDFYYSRPDERGGINQLDFSVNGEQANWEFDPYHADIALVRLNNPLAPGENITIETPFFVKIPNSFSRLGHVEDSYQITQWYPKPAVYDQDGWHPMPYLDIGEFYSDFGSFDVSITLPANYVVAATGVLQTETEKEWLDQKIAETASVSLSGLDTIPGSIPSASRTKTIQYKAEQVHDFAWFADKRFYVTKSEITLEGGDKVETYAYFTSEEAFLWKDATKYLNRSVEYFSGRLGNYPWPQMTAVQSALSAGEGMEYPMITVIGLSGSDLGLDEVITHEVGHNWFYGILANNERDFAWMDEGFVTFYESAYMEENYNYRLSLGDLLPFSVSAYTGAFEEDLFMVAFRYAARMGKDLPVNLTSDQYPDENYFISVYDKPGLALRYLETYIGREAFDDLMQTYYQKWKFKHPRPEDFFTILDEKTDQDVSWLTEGLLSTDKKIDYALKRSGNDQVKVINKGEIKGPFSISGVKDGELEQTTWYEGVEGEQTIDFPVSQFDNVVLDGPRLIPEINTRNNYLKRKFNLKFLGEIEQPDKKSLYFAPIIGGNAYDKFMVGLSFYNSLVLSKRFEFFLNPMLATGPLDVAGTASFDFHSYPRSGFARRITVGAGYRTFSYNRLERFLSDGSGPEAIYLRYHTIRPSIEVELRKKDNRSHLTHSFELSSNILSFENSVFDTVTVNNPVLSPNDTLITAFFGTEQETRAINRLTYRMRSTHPVNPVNVTVMLEQFTDRKQFPRDFSYVKLSAEADYRYYYRKGKAVQFRVYGSGFLQNGASSDLDTLGSSFGIYPVSLISQGRSDYHNDQFFFGRNENDGLWAQQIYLDQGGFKTPLPTSSKGTSNKFVFALNIKSDLPFDIFLPIKPYLDVGYFRETERSVLINDIGVSDQLFFNGGLALEFGEGVFGVYFPLFSSSNLDTLLKSQGGYTSRISFTLNLDLANPFKLKLL